LRVQTRLEIAKLHHEMRDVTMIYVTHDQVEAMTLADRICVLRDGLVEQVGTPTELYDHPNSIFVAGFIGSPKMNFLDGSFAAPHGCATLGIRSEHIDIVPQGAGLWTGTVIHAEDLGSDNYLFVDLRAKEPVIVRQPGKVAIPEGSTVSLMPRAGLLHRFDESGRPVQAPLAAE
jgi:multiple sugar transport system ATP-binding protein